MVITIIPVNMGSDCLFVLCYEGGDGAAKHLAPRKDHLKEVTLVDGLCNTIRH